MSYIRPFKKYQSSNLQNWLFLWHRHLSTQSLKFCVFMNNSYTIDKITYLTSMFEFMLTWPFGKVMLKYQFFSKPSGFEYDWKQRKMKIKTAFYLKSLIVKKCWCCKKVWIKKSIFKTKFQTTFSKSHQF